MARAALPPISHERITAVVDRVLGSFVAGGQLRGDEADDVRSAVMLRVLQQIEPAANGEAAVRSIEDYVARMTINAANDVLRAQRSAPAPLSQEEETAVDRSQQLQETLATRQLLVLLWDEIATLPLMQRRALLLHIRDQGGGSAIHLLVFTGVATVDEIAHVLEYTRAEIEALWDSLPLSDLQIAAKAGATRQQIISLRRAARERLERARRRLALPRSRR